jgi:hypothetical protein
VRRVRCGLSPALLDFVSRYPELIVSRAYS